MRSWKSAHRTTAAADVLSDVGSSTRSLGQIFEERLQPVPVLWNTSMNDARISIPSFGVPANPEDPGAGGATRAKPML